MTIIKVRSKDIKIRSATLDDRKDFLRLWKLYLEEGQEHGGVILPNTENLLEFLRIFDSYMVGSLWGACIVAEHLGSVMGVCMGGEDFGGGAAFQTTWGKIGRVWGLYVEKDYRRMGISKKIRQVSYEHANVLGFDTIVTDVLAGDPAAKANAESWWAKPAFTVVFGHPSEQATPTEVSL